MIRLRRKWLATFSAALAKLGKPSVMKQMIIAEIKTASAITAIRLSAADIRQAAVNFPIAIRVIAEGGNAVANVALPSFIETQRPTHIFTLQGSKRLNGRHARLGGGRS